MWSANIPFSDLVSRGRWKVEFFCSDVSARRNAAYESIALGDLLAERKEFLDPQEYSDWTFNYVGLENVASFTGDIVDFEPKKGREIRSRSKVFRVGDVLYGRLRPNLNKVLLVDENIEEGICSGEFYVLIPDKSKMLPHFARWLLASRYVQDAVAGLITGSALPRLQLVDLFEIEVPIPPLDDQRAFEATIIRENERRRRMASEAANSPRLLMDAVVEALETGNPLADTFSNGLEVGSGVFKNPLPSSEHTGRKRKVSGQAELNFS